MLASSLEYEETLARVAELAVPRLADWCVVDVAAEDGTLERVALAHVDENKVRRVRELAERHPRRTDSHQGAARVIRTRVPELVPLLTPEALDTLVGDEPELR